MNESHESVPVVMLDPADVATVTACQSNIRQSLTYIEEILKRHLPDGATIVSVHAAVYDSSRDTWVSGAVLVLNGYGPGSTYGHGRIDSFATDTILRAFDEACAQFKAQLAAAKEDGDVE